jgi:hypothetical protein
MKIYLAHSTHFDFKDKLYGPLRGSTLNTEHELLFPHETDAPPEITRDMIQGCDALIADVSAPSLGVGIEMGWADAFHVPVIAMSEKGSKVSFSIDNVTTQRFEYDGPDDMIAKVESALTSIAKPE